MANSVAYHNSMESVTKAQSVFQEDRVKQMPHPYFVDGKSYYIFKEQIVELSTNTSSNSTTFNNDINSDILNKKIRELEKLFNLEWQKNKRYIKVDNQGALNSIHKAIKQVSKINYEKILVELSPTNAVIFKILLKKENNLLLLLTIPFAQIQDLGEGEVIYSLFENRELIVSNAKLIEDIVEGINEYTEQ